MNKNMVKLISFGAAGVTALSLLTFSIDKAAVMSNEKPMAGIALSLNKYYEMVASSNDKTLSVMSLDTNQVTVDQTQNTDVAEDEDTDAPDDAEQAQDADPEKERDIDQMININYDRLGIASVDNYLNIRKKPGEDGKVIGKLPKNAGCNVEDIKDGWAKIKSGKVSGYVKSEFLVLDKDAEALALKVGSKMATVNTTTLKVRALPTEDSRVYSLVPNGEDLEVVKENVTEDYVNKFMDKHSKKDKTLTDGVNKDSMMAGLNDWICVKIDDEIAFVAKEYTDPVIYALDRAVFVEDIAEDGSDGVSSTRAQMVQFAKQFLGNPYVWGGTSLTNGTDCSGFTMGIYSHFGYGIPRTSGAQAASSRSVSSSDVRPGDLFFYGNGSRVSHVAMYIGNGLVIHASNPRTGIKISNAYYRSPIKIGRFVKE